MGQRWYSSREQRRLRQGAVAARVVNTRARPVVRWALQVARTDGPRRRPRRTGLVLACTRVPGDL
jgi:hypothetical protein